MDTIQPKSEASIASQRIVGGWIRTEDGALLNPARISSIMPLLAHPNTVEVIADTMAGVSVTISRHATLIEARTQVAALFEAIGGVADFISDADLQEIERAEPAVSEVPIVPLAGELIDALEETLSCLDHGRGDSPVTTEQHMRLTSVLMRAKAQVAR
jgi:hypothetical protein